MTIKRNERIEFNPQKDLLGGMLKRRHNHQIVIGLN